MFSVVPRVFEEVDPVLRWADDLGRWPALISRYVPEPLCNFGEAEIHNTDREFRVRMELRHFKPDEVKITSDNHCITVHAKHEEKQDNHGYISREITRSYRLPDNVDPKSVTSFMNNQGILSIKVDKYAIEAPKETPIPIQFKK